MSLPSTTEAPSYKKCTKGEPKGPAPDQRLFGDPDTSTIVPENTQTTITHASQHETAILRAIMDATGTILRVAYYNALQHRTISLISLLPHKKTPQASNEVTTILDFTSRILDRPPFLISHFAFLTLVLDRTYKSIVIPPVVAAVWDEVDVGFPWARAYLHAAGEVRRRCSKQPYYYGVRVIFNAAEAAAALARSGFPVDVQTELYGIAQEMDDCFV
ncbi:hypothetical protein DFH06DRAFT_1253829 [Mycena polygramma]|nr:hypothetical protein DFH06DRAFT_1253829 [Mycena polygramma]